MIRVLDKIDSLRGTAEWIVSKLPLETQEMLWEATVDQALLSDLGSELRRSLN
jgi:hypothetical protein